jgi:uncharacterized protein (DUF3820 family)
MITMPFGRYKDREITAVPRGYLRWLRDNVPLEPPLAYFVNCVLNKQSIDLNAVDLRTDEEKVAEIVKPWQG